MTGKMQWRWVWLAPALAVAGGCADLRDSASAKIVDSVTGTMLGPKPHKPADFVTASRPDNPDYLPVGVTPPKRAVAPKTKSEIAAAEAAMAAESARQAAVGAAAEAEGQRLKSNPPKAPTVE